MQPFEHWARHARRAGFLSLLATGLAAACPPGTGTPCDACDWDENGVVDCNDLSLFLVDFNTPNPCADFNGDNQIDFFDYLAFKDCLDNSTCGIGAPVNDSCASPTLVIGVGVFPYQNCLATNSATEGAGPGCGATGPVSISKDLWYCWTAPCDGMAHLSTLGLLHPGQDSKLAVYSGCACPASIATALGCSDNFFGSLESQFDFPVTAGTQYLFQIGDSPNAAFPFDQGGAGSFRLIITPANDICATAITVIAPSTTNFCSTSAVTDGPNQPSCYFPLGNDNLNNDIFYKFIATANGSLTAVVTGNFDTRVAIYQGTTCAGMAARIIGCNDSANCTGFAPNPSGVTANVQIGQTYLIRVGGGLSNPSGSGTLRVSFAPGPNMICPPAGPPYKGRLYLIIGNGVGSNWSWSVQTPCAVVSDLNAPGATGNASVLAARFTTNINNPPFFVCFQNRIRATNPFTSYMVVRVGGTDLPSLWVGPPNVLPNCLVRPGPALPPHVGTCTFNPDIEEIPLSEQDCNNNGDDDTIDIVMGTSLDRNNNGIPDECECPADINHDGQLDFFDYLDFVAAYDAGDDVADFNRDGQIDFFDYLDFVASYSDGCPG